MELEKNLRNQFGYLLNPDESQFLPVFWLATYLSPVHCQALTRDEVEEAKKYLRSKCIGSQNLRTLVLVSILKD